MIHTSASGSLMVMGEHAVLHGQPCLVTAIDQRLHVRLTPRPDTDINIQSALGQWHGQLNTLLLEPACQFVVSTLRHFTPTQGCDIEISSEFRSDIGFGSSAAVVVALCLALNTWLDMGLSKAELLQHAVQIIRGAQGRGSGADAAASLYGGLLGYEATDQMVTPTPALPCPIFAVYSGSKTPTPKVIKWLQENTEKAHLQNVYQQIGQLTRRAILALGQHDVTAFLETITDHQQIQKDLQLSTPQIDWILTRLANDPNTHCAKISGAGLGDCVLGFGSYNQVHFDQDQAKAHDIYPIAIAIDTRGALLHA